MSQLRAGYYDIRGARFLQHTYLQMTDNKLINRPVNFNCYGGHDDRQLGKILEKGNTRSTNVTCDEKIAFYLSTMNGRPRFNESEQSKFWSWSGLVYGLGGVCHQMANTILAAATPDDVAHGWLLKPPSFSASKLLFSNRGMFGAARDYTIQTFINKLVRFEQLPTEQQNSESAQRDLNSELLGAIDPYSRLNQQYLTMPYPRNSRAKELSSYINNQDSLNTLLDTVDKRVFQQKQKLDRDLLLDNIAHADYTAKVNALAQTLATNVFKLQSLESRKASFPDMTIADLDKTNIVETEFMPTSYADYRSEFGLK
ncbi:hypothetical protein ACRYI5_01170 [Furfurilactobacillus sp. WILCCON 0119]